MNIALIIIVIIFVILISIWAFYNFYWLNKPQVYLVYKPANMSFPYDATQGEALAQTFGGHLATLDDVVESFNAGASNCTYGYAACTGCTSSDKDCALFCSSPTAGANVFPLNVNGVSGGVVIPNCGTNGMLNTNTINAAGYWIKGSKPASSSVNGWTVAPFHGPNGPDTTNIFNRYEVLNIPKIF